jgi:speckle-type POZ protein
MGNTTASAAEQPAERMESRCVPQTAVGTLSFQLTDYRQRKDDIGIGYSIESPRIRLGGFSWCLRCYLNGDRRKESEGFVGIYLKLRSKNGRARAMFNIGLIDQTTMSSSTIGRPPSAPLVFNDSLSWGFKNSSIMWRTYLENSSYLINDSLLFQCEITVIKEPQVVKKTVTTNTIVKTPQPVRNLTYDLGRLLETMDEADVVFDVQGHVFPAHTVMLAMRSPVFREQFHAAAVRQQLGDGGGRHLRLMMTIQDMQPEVFKALLEFMYTDSLCRRRKKGITRDEKIEFTKNLLVAAYRYDVERLKFECETYLCRTLRLL